MTDNMAALACGVAVAGHLIDAGKEFPVIFGADPDGDSVIYDLSDLPHLLIAGEVNTGKSGLLHLMIMGLLMSCEPEDIRLLLLAPGSAEFHLYAGIPHLVSPIVSDVKQSVESLTWLCRELSRRFSVFRAARFRNIKEFNASCDGMPMPRIIVVIDELTDFAGDDQWMVEEMISRLGMMGRAVGIHLVISTRQPRISVLTGVIRATFPVRAAFRMSNLIDSRMVIGCLDAHQLKSSGDMLLRAPDCSGLRSVQVPHVLLDELLRVVKWRRKQAEPTYLFTRGGGRPGLQLPAAEVGLKVALDLIEDTGRASISHFQRCLKIGYSKAARLMADLENCGIVGPARGRAPRKINLSPLLMENNDPERDEDADLLGAVTDFVRTKKSVSASMVQRHFRIGFCRAAHLIDRLENLGIVGVANESCRRRVL